jgi:hypothetical protein
MNAKRFSGEVARTGFATSAVIGMLLLVAAAVLAATMLFATEMRRTRDASIHAQQRQLLLAGAAEALRTAPSVGGTKKDFQVNLPSELAAHASLHVSIGPAANATLPATVQTVVDGQPMRQTVTLARAGERGWIIREARLEGMQ